MWRWPFSWFRRQPLGRPAGGRDPLGPAGEALARAHLRRAGYRIVGMNIKVPMGEADILCVAPAPDRRTLVLVEVKSRRLGPGGEEPFHAPEASITAHKRTKLRAILRHLDRANQWSASARPTRIDTIAIEWPADARARPAIRHHQNSVPLAER